MELTFECPKCRMIDHVDHVESAGEALCRHCHTTSKLHRDAFRPSGLAACPFCGADDLHVRKDRTLALGLAVALLGFAAAVGLWYDGRPRTAYLVLGVTLALDLLLHRRASHVAICRRCGSQIRGVGVDPHHSTTPKDA